MCIGETVILGISGAYLISVPTMDSDACINFKTAGILGVICTLLGIIAAAFAGEADRPAFEWAGPAGTDSNLFCLRPPLRKILVPREPPEHLLYNYRLYGYRL
jgi:hypothetical protein